MIAPDSSSGRLVDMWPGDTAGEPAAIVADLRRRAPAWLRSRIRPMTTAEQRIWRYFGDRSWMGAEVFPQVPVYIPEACRGFVLGFLIPACRAAVEIVAPGPGEGLEALAHAMEQDDLVRDKAGIATLRSLEPMALRDPEAVAMSIRWTLGLDKGGDGFFGINVPRP
ncbi:MAG: hypothetical protein L6Q95_18600 [Planctomycetes bacterium]|nr:hypothetical protein [Planctomycetota bacterium]